MRRVALLLLVLPIACASEPPANESQESAAPAVNAAPIVPAQDALPAQPEASPAPPPVPRETSGRPAVPKDDRPDDYRAIGTEPFWAVTVRDEQLLLQRPDQPPLRVAVARDVQPRAMRYTGEGFTMDVTPGPCSDGMSDAIWSDRVQIAFAQGTLKGCGGLREGGE